MSTFGTSRGTGKADMPCTRCGSADHSLTPDQKHAKIDALQVQRNDPSKKVMTTPAVRATQ